MPLGAMKELDSTLCGCLAVPHCRRSPRPPQSASAPNQDRQVANPPCADLAAVQPIGDQNDAEVPGDSRGWRDAVGADGCVENANERQP